MERGLEIFDPTTDAIQTLLEHVVRACVAQADVAFATVTERAPGNDTDLVVLDHVVGELLGGHPRAADVREHVERAVGGLALDAVDRTGWGEGRVALGLKTKG